MPRRKTGAKRALVLGCGGVAGAAWSIAMLDAVQRELDWDAREAAVLIGTSAGAVLAALLGAGVSVDRLMACQQGDVECVWDHEHDSGGALPPWPALRFPAARLAWKGLRGQLDPLTAVAALLPAGRCDMRPFMRLIDSVVTPGEWVPHPACWIMAVDTRTGARVAFGHDSAPPARLNLAVCASYGVPGWCPPVRIGRRTYLDGGMASPTSADFLVGSGVTEAVVLAPMAAQEPDRPASALLRAERVLRRHMTAIVKREVAMLEEAGIRTILLAPGAEDLDSFGYNMMDPTRRLRVFDTALRTSEETVRAALA
ncbi:MAG: patatin-like phospholipase family protein [Nevskia sp.]|nr:patatin-like phospholipase family protein [Nevskia sp.]